MQYMMRSMHICSAKPNQSPTQWPTFFFFLGGGGVDGEGETDLISIISAKIDPSDPLMGAEGYFIRLKAKSHRCHQKCTSWSQNTCTTLQYGFSKQV